MQSVTETLPAKRDLGVAHNFNCPPPVRRGCVLLTHLFYDITLIRTLLRHERSIISITLYGQSEQLMPFFTLSLKSKMLCSFTERNVRLSNVRISFFVFFSYHAVD